MSQNSLVLPTTGTVSGLTMTQNINNALDTLNTNGSGGSAPSSPEAFMFWADSTNNAFKMRNEANSAWLSLFDTNAGISLIPEASRDASMTVNPVSASGTFTASQVTVAAALGGLCAPLANFNQTINLATTGAGGMDTGTAPTSGYVALYAIYNPTTATRALLATNATSVAAPLVYGGANMPAGYTLSALVSVWPTNASKQFIFGYQIDRTVCIVANNVLTTTGQTASPLSLAIAGAVPPNAKRTQGLFTMSTTAASTLTFIVSSTPTNFTYENYFTVPATGVRRSVGGADGYPANHLLRGHRVRGHYNAEHLRQRLHLLRTFTMTTVYVQFSDALRSPWSACTAVRRTRRLTEPGRHR